MHKCDFQHVYNLYTNANEIIVAFFHFSRIQYSLLVYSVKCDMAFTSIIGTEIVNLFNYLYHLRFPVRFPNMNVYKSKSRESYTKAAHVSLHNLSNVAVRASSTE